MGGEWHRGSPQSAPPGPTSTSTGRPPAFLTPAQNTDAMRHPKPKPAGRVRVAPWPLWGLRGGLESLCRDAVSGRVGVRRGWTWGS